VTRTLSFLRTLVNNRLGRVDKPRFLTYIVTFRCNARCIMCDSWKLEQQDELDIEEVERIFKDLPQLDSIRLTGGEPFIRQDLGDIIELARVHLRPLFAHITSNGFLTDRIVETLETRNRKLPLYLLISVDGLEQSHDLIRGRKGSWDKVIATIEALSDRQQELNIHLAVNQTIVDDQGLRQYQELHDFLKPYGISNNPVLAYENSATYSIDVAEQIAPTRSGDYSPFGELDKQALEQFLHQAESNLRHYPMGDRIAKNYYLKGIRNRLLNTHGKPNPRCVALRSHLRLYPDGQVPVCQFNSNKVGSLRESSWQECWHSNSTQAMRNWVDDCPGCWAECEVLPNAIYTGDIVRGTLR